jgi:hypothetical protein
MSLTRFTIRACKSRDTCARVRVDGIGAATSVLARRTLTFVDVYKTDERGICQLYAVDMMKTYYMV